MDDQGGEVDASLFSAASSLIPSDADNDDADADADVDVTADASAAQSWSVEQS